MTNSGASLEHTGTRARREIDRRLYHWAQGAPRRLGRGRARTPTPLRRQDPPDRRRRARPIRRAARHRQTQQAQERGRRPTQTEHLAGSAPRDVRGLVGKLERAQHRDRVVQDRLRRVLGRPLPARPALAGGGPHGREETQLGDRRSIRQARRRQSDRRPSPEAMPRRQARLRRRLAVRLHVRPPARVVSRGQRLRGGLRRPLGRGLHLRLHARQQRASDRLRAEHVRLVGALERPRKHVRARRQGRFPRRQIPRRDRALRQTQALRVHAGPDGDPRANRRRRCPANSRSGWGLPRLVRRLADQGGRRAAATSTSSDDGTAARRRHDDDT